MVTNNNNLNNLITYCHCTKEIIQFIKFLKGEINIPETYSKICFRTGVIKDTYINYNIKYYNIFNTSNICIIEICSNTKYIYNNLYLYNFRPNIKKYYKNVSKEILNNYKVEKQSDEEIENDILEIQKLLYPKKIIIVSHYNAKLNNRYLDSRNNLINLLDTICKKYNINFINPTNCPNFTNFTQEEIMSNDMAHYTALGILEFSKYINNYIQNIIL